MLKRQPAFHSALRLAGAVAPERQSGEDIRRVKLGEADRDLLLIVCHFNLVCCITRKIPANILPLNCLYFKHCSQIVGRPQEAIGQTSPMSNYSESCPACHARCPLSLKKNRLLCASAIVCPPELSIML